MQGRAFFFLELKKEWENRKDSVGNGRAREMVVAPRVIRGHRIRLIDLFCIGESSRLGVTNALIHLEIHHRHEAFRNLL